METPLDYGEEEINETNSHIETVKFIDYLKLPIKEIKIEILKKNKELIKLNEQKEESKTKLNVVIKDLNELVSNNSEMLCQKDPDLFIISQLERRFGMKNKDLETSKKINKTFKSQYKSMTLRVNKVLDPEKINAFEDEIDNLKKENIEMNIKIKKLKENNLQNSKKIEILKSGKKHNEQIKSQTEEIKSLGSKKHDYYTKLSSTKKSLDNVIKEREVLEKLYKQNIRKTKDKYLIQSINFWLDLINSDLEGTQEDIIKKVENNESKVVKEVDKNSINNSINNPLYLPILNIKKYDDQIRSLSRDKKSNLKKSNIKKHKNITININDLSITSRLNIKQNLSLSSSRKGKKTDIFKEKLKRQKLMLNKKSNSILMRTENNELNDISFEYELTNDNEYRELLNKKDKYVKMINKLEESIKEAQKV